MITDIPVDIFRWNVLVFVDNINEYINLSCVRNVEFRRFVLNCLRGSELSLVNSYSGSHLFWLLWVGVTVRLVAATGLVGDDVLEILILMRSCRSVSFYASLVKEKMISCRHNDIQNSNAATAPRLLEEVNFCTDKANIDFKLLGNCSHLHTIRIYDADDNILHKLSEYCLNIRALGLEGAYSNDGLSHLLQRYPNLQSIHLRGSGLSDNVLGILAQMCPNIQKITVNGLSFRLDIGDGCILALIHGCPNISSLNLSGRKITDAHVIALSRAYPNLLSVGFTASNLTDQGVITLSKQYHKSQSVTLSNTIVTNNT